MRPPVYPAPRSCPRPRRRIPNTAGAPATRKKTMISHRNRALAFVILATGASASARAQDYWPIERIEAEAEAEAALPSLAAADSAASDGDSAAYTANDPLA